VLRRIELEVSPRSTAATRSPELATKLDHSESYLSCRRRPRRKGGRLHGTRRPAKTSRSVGCSRRRTLPGPRPPALPHRLPRTADREGARGAVLPRPAANCLPRSLTGATTTATRSTVSSSGFVTVVSSGRPTATTSSTPTSTASTSLPVKSHTICTVTASKPLPRRARFSGRTTTNSSPRPKRRSMRRRSTKPASLDSRPSTSSSCSPIIATTSTPRNPTQSRRRSSAVTRC